MAPGPDFEQQWAELVGSLELDPSVSLLEADSHRGIKLILANDEEEFDTFVSLYDALERSVARRMLTEEEIELVMSLVEGAIRANGIKEFLTEQVTYEHDEVTGENYAIIGFAPSKESNNE